MTEQSKKYRNYFLFALTILLGLGIAMAIPSLALAQKGLAAESSAQSQLPESLAALTPFWSEDFSSPIDPAMNFVDASPGSGVISGTYFLLTQDAADQRGRIFYRDLAPMHQFEASFDLYLGDKDGAHGATFQFCPDYAYTPGTGTTLDASCPGGYIIAYDTAIGGPQDYVLLSMNTVASILVPVPVPELENGAWHTSTVQLDHGLITVTLDGANVLAGYSIPNYQPFAGYFGFSAATGTSTNQHRIDNIEVLALQSGNISGTLTSSSSALPLEDVAVQATLMSDSAIVYNATSDAAGDYGFPTIPTGAYTLSFSLFGYEPQTLTNVDVLVDTTTTVDLALDPTPTYMLSGLVTDAVTGWPLYASIDIDGYPGDPIWSDPESGYFSISLPQGITYTIHTDSWVDGYVGESREVAPLTSDSTEDFALVASALTCEAPGYSTGSQIFYDGFESGDLTAGGWLTSTTNIGRVRVSTDYPYAGSYSVLLDNTTSGSNSLAGIIKPIDLSTHPAVALDFWWREFDDEDHSGDGVFISDDSGTTWCQAFSFNNGPNVFTNSIVDLSAAASGCGMSLGANTQILFQFEDNYSIDTDGYAIDEVVLKGPCLPPADGGLLVGNVYDENTGLPVVAAMLDNEDGQMAETAATPLDENLDDGFFTIFSPSGSKTFTATKSSYGADIDIVSVVMSDTVSHDFNLPAGWLSANPDQYHVSLDLGVSTTLPLNIINAGNFEATFELIERNDGFDPVMLSVQSNFKDLSQVGPDISISTEEDNGKTLLAGPEEGVMGQILAPTTPNPWVVIPSMPVGASRPAGAVVDGTFYVVGGEPSVTRSGDVQIYDPDLGSWDNTSPKMPVPVSNICAAVIGTDIYVPGGYTDGSIGITDLQVFHTDTSTWETITSDPLPAANFGAACASYNDKLYVFGGEAGAHWVYDPNASPGFRWVTSLSAPPIASNYGSALAVNDLIFYAGLGATSNLADVLAYDPGLDTWTSYPSLNTGRGGAGMWAIGNMLYVGGGGWSSYLNSVEAYDTNLGASGSWSLTNPMLQGRRTFAYASAPETGMLFVGAGWAGAFLSEAEQTIFPPFSSGVPWLFEDPISGTVAIAGDALIDLTFDAGVPEVTQPGDYYATLVVKDDSPYSSINIPVTMTVNTPAVWGKLAGTLTLLGYCDADPITPANQEILIKGSSGFTDTTKTDQDGYFQYWIDPSENPVSVSVLPIKDYLETSTTGIQVVTGQTTTVDFDLRIQKPCVSIDPSALERVLFLGESVNDSFSIYNNGAFSSTFEITETSSLDWFSAAPLTGTLDADSMASISTVFDSSALTQTGWYSGDLRLDNDDTIVSPIMIPVDMIVVSGTPGVALSPNSTLIGEPGQLVTHTFTVTNTGDVIDIFELSVSGNNWSSLVSPLDTSFINPGEAMTFTVSVQIPYNPAIQSVIISGDSFDVTATSQLDGSFASASGTTQAEVDPGVSLSDDQDGSDIVGRTVDYTLLVTNSGTYTDTFSLAVSGNSWVTSLSFNSLTLAAGESRNLTASVTIAADASQGDQDLATVTATSTLDPSVSDQAVLTTTAMKYWIFLPTIFK